MLRMRRQQVEKIPTPPQLRYYKQLIIHTKHIKQPNDIVMSPQFPQYVHLLLKLGNVLWIIAQHDAFAREFLALALGGVGLVAFRLAAGGDADLTVGSLADYEIAME